MTYMNAQGIHLDILITLRCNAACMNCIKFCNKGKVTGLDYSDSDMTLEQIDEFVRQIKELNIPGLFHSICLTGGEPLLHPKVSEILDKMKELQGLGYVKRLSINSNTILPAPEHLKKYIVNYSTPKKKLSIHNTALLHPNDFGGTKMTYRACGHYRKNTVVLTYQGFSLCCAADGYIRLFGKEDLIFDHLPLDISETAMDTICEHCPFGNDKILPLEKDAGCPVSDIYRREAEKNRTGRKITKRFLSRKK